MSSDSLFRPEAVKQQGVKLDGDVIIAQPLSVTLLLSGLLLAVLIALVFLCQSSFNRKETVVGYLKPDVGMARVASQRSGTVVSLSVNEGQLVEAGQELARISSEEYLGKGENLTAQLGAALEQQQQSLQQRLQQYELSSNEQQLAVRERISNAQAQLAEIRAKQQLMQERFKIQQLRLDDYQKLREKGHLSAAEFNNQQELVLSLRQQQTDLQLSYQTQRSQLIQLQAQLESQGRELTQQKAQLAAEQARLDQQKSEIQARGEVVLTAPISGRVTNLTAEIGSMAAAGRPVLTILPKDSELYAILLVPTRAFGFIEPGQETRLRFDAFPYQRFGLYEGTVVQYSKAILIPNEIEMPIPIQEPVYQVRVKLNSQNIKAYGAEVPLQAGMLLSADIVLESRSLLSWLFEPLLSLRGRL